MMRTRLLVNNVINGTAQPAHAADAATRRTRSCVCQFLLQCAYHQSVAAPLTRNPLEHAASYTITTNTALSLIRHFCSLWQAVQNYLRSPRPGLPPNEPWQPSPCAARPRERSSATSRPLPAAVVRPACAASAVRRLIHYVQSARQSSGPTRRSMLSARL